jgi:hypothetical protein
VFVIEGLGFYEAASQVSLILAILFFLLESGGPRTVWDYMARWMRLQLVAWFVFVAFAEWRALHVLWTEHAAQLDPWIVWLALAGLAGGIIFAATGNPFSPTKKLPLQQLEDLERQVAQLQGEAEALRPPRPHDEET